MDPERQRFHSFKMGGGLDDARSRSRNSLSSAPAPEPPSASLPRRPNSHHRRRSSVSTRRESAELMGVSLPDLPPANSDDNVNLGDKDSIRRRALWALEGKPDMAFAKVEIPDIPPFEFPTKPSFPPGSGTSTYPGKRDSFGKMFGSMSISKDQLGTLVEEEEEEEEEEKGNEDTRSSADIEDCSLTPQNTSLPAKTTSRHRPASLNLRPLSLVQGSVVSPAAGNLPTPTLTPSGRPHTRKPFVPDDAIVNLPPSGKSTPARHTSSRHLSYTYSDGPTFAVLDKKRRSSISYKCSTDSIPRDVFPLPTPEMTPVDRRFSLASDQDSLAEQPLSVADQHFLFRSHHLLLSRITELERTLKSHAPRSRHSYTSDASVPASEPSDEMLQLISDLKAERDELKRDVDGWRQRVADAEKHAGMLAKRIESERKEAWVARSRLGLLEVEKSSLEKSVETKTATLSQSMAENEALMRERDGMKEEIMKLTARLKDADAAVDECTRLRAALEQERTRRKELEKLLDDAGLLNTPKLAHTTNGSWRRFSAKPVSIRPRGLGFQSIDSESSTTDVESADDSFTKAEFTLDAVAEEVEFSDEENGLAGYEDEEDSDLGFSSPGGSSIGSADELDIQPKAENKPKAEDNHSVNPLPSQPTHQSRASISKTWTFPRGKSAALVKQDDEVDRFFGCLDDVDKSPPLSEEMNQSAFASAFRSMSDDDELPPFVLPSDVGVVVESTSFKSLDVVPEEGEVDCVADDEDEDDLVGEEVEGGIRFTFNPPPVTSVTPPSDFCTTPAPPEIRVTPPAETLTTTPAVRIRMDRSISDGPEPFEDDDECPFAFVFPVKVQPSHAERVTSPPRSSLPTTNGRPHQSSRNDSPPSSIPRAISLRSMSPKTPSIMFTPSKNPGRFTAPLGYSTPPSKKTTSSIPQPVVSPPKCYSTPTKAQTSAISSKQSQSGTPNVNDPVSDTRCPTSVQSGGATSAVNCSNHPDPSFCEYSHAHGTSPSLSSIMSNPLAARLPFQKLSNFISFSWTPGATAVASYIVPGSLGSPSVEAPATATPQSACPAQRGFVSKARQLEKLRSRFNLEKKNGTMPCSMVGACKGCSASNVYL